MEKLVEVACPGCLCISEENFLLPCKHTLCAVCLDAEAKRSIGVLRADGQECEESEAPVVCAVCRMVSLRSEAVPCEDLNVSAKGILEANERKPKMCCWKGCEEEAEYYRPEDGFVCGAHMHENSSAFYAKVDKTRNQLWFWLDPAPKMEMCFLHGEELKYVCVTCKCFACAECSVFGKHKGHNITPLVGGCVDGYRRILDDKRTKLAEFRANSDGYAEKLRAAVNREFDVLIEELNRQREIVMTQLNGLLDGQAENTRKKEEDTRFMMDEMDRVMGLSFMNKFVQGKDTIGNIVHVMRVLYNESQALLEGLARGEDEITWTSIREGLLPGDLVTIEPPVPKKPTFQPWNLKNVVSTTSFKTDIRTPFSKWYFQGMNYDGKRKQLMINSWEHNRGRDFVIVTFMEDGTSRVSEMKDLVPFNTTHVVYDGEDFLYAYQNGGSQFGRVNLDKMAFESLPGFDGFSGSGSPLGYIEGDNLYLILYKTTPSQYATCRYHIPSRRWLLLLPDKYYTTNIHKHPHVPGRCVEIDGNGMVREFDIELNGNAKTYESKYPHANERPDSCLVSDGESGFLLFCRYHDQPWRVFSSRQDTWRDLPGWEKVSTPYTNYLCYVPDQYSFYYVVKDEHELYKVPFLFNPAKQHIEFIAT